MSSPFRPPTPAEWDERDPFVYDADGLVVGLKAEPPHHRALLALGFTGGENLHPLVVGQPEAFTADCLVYRQRVGRAEVTAVLPEVPPYVYGFTLAVTARFPPRPTQRRTRC